MTGNEKTMVEKKRTTDREKMLAFRASITVQEAK